MPFTTFSGDVTVHAANSSEGDVKLSLSLVPYLLLTSGPCYRETVTTGYTCWYPVSYAKSLNC